MTDVPARRAGDPRLDEMSTRIDRLACQHEQIAKEVHKNTEITERIDRSTAGLVEAWTALSGGLKVLNTLGKVAKWATYIAGLFTALFALYYTAKGGVIGPGDIPK